MLDELLGDFFTQTKGRTGTPIVELMEWSHAQTLLPTVHRGSFTKPQPVPHITRQIAQEDSALIDWLLGIANDKPVTAGGFLHCLADFALRADDENFPIFRPALLAMKEKYPQYKFTEADGLAAGERFSA
jgi:hypothetical protein